MKKRFNNLLWIVLSVWMLSACGRAGNEEENQSVHIPLEENTQSIENTDRNTEDTLTSEQIPQKSTEASTEERADSNEKTGDTQMRELIIEVGGQQFQATLYDNETAQALKERLPMTLEMEELHGNEKFYYLDEGLPANSESVGSIHTGDLMLFGSDCLVLFFDDFSTSYRYTRIGYIEDEEAFADALAGGTVEVTFKTGE